MQSTAVLAAPAFNVNAPYNTRRATAVYDRSVQHDRVCPVDLLKHTPRGV